MAQYDTIEELEAAVETIDNTTYIRPFNVINRNERKYALIVGRVGTYIDGGTL
jgi:hypothetical protein